MPVGSLWGAGFGLPTGTPGLTFAGFRLVVRDGTEIPFDRRYPSGALDDVLAALPELMAAQVARMRAALMREHRALTLPGSKQLGLTRPLVMGVLNVTPDSFSDGGHFLDTGAAITRARQLVAEGADIIDIGGESTRPGATPVWEGEEAERVVPVIEALCEDGITLSIDTRHASVMDKALLAGADILNDVSALTYDPESILVAAGSTAPVVLMHAQGQPKTMQDAPSYDDVLLDVYDYLAGRVQACEQAGISRDRLIVDPGLGFGKRVVRDNLALMNGLGLFRTLGCPLLLGASRKRFIGAVTGEEVADKRLGGSVAAALRGVAEGAQIVRVHDVAETSQALKLQQAMYDSAMMGLMP